MRDTILTMIETVMRDWSQDPAISPEDFCVSLDRLARAYTELAQLDALFEETAALPRQSSL